MNESGLASTPEEASNSSDEDPLPSRGTVATILDRIGGALVLPALLLAFCSFGSSQDAGAAGRGQPDPRGKTEEVTDGEQSQSGRAGAPGEASSRRLSGRIELPAAELRANLEAIERGLDSLAKKARSGDGSLSKRYSVAVTALGGMAMLGHGVQYNRGRHGQYLARCVEFLLNRQRSDGYLEEGAGNSRSRMHGHAYAVLFLAQVVGQVPFEEKNKRVREAVTRGIRIIERSQTADGGWGYQPKSAQQDEASITVCCLQAMRAAKDAGFVVDFRVIEKALWYLQACAKEDGSFRYSLRGNPKSTYELTAAAVSTLDAAGEYSADIHRRGVEFMLARLRPYRKRPLEASTQFAHYGNLYAAQVYFQLGGEIWKGWARYAYPQLRKDQKADGSWESPQFGDEYATAMALLMLEIPLGLLPIFER